MNAQRPLRGIGVAVAMIAMASGCATTAPAPPTVASPSSGTARLAIARITGASGSLVSGSLRLLPSADGVHVTGAIGGLAPGSRHGLHVHANGNCNAADASSAGDVLQPPPALAARGHHGHAEGHDIVADAEGVAHVNLLLAQRTLGGGASDVAGRALVVHALPDAAATAPAADLRIGCGVIAVEPSP